MAQNRVRLKSPDRRGREGEYMDYAGVGKEKLNRARETAEDLIDQAGEMKERLGRGANEAWKESKRAYARLQDSAED